jgi:hypothetical protein
VKDDWIQSELVSFSALYPPNVTIPVRSNVNDSLPISENCYPIKLPLCNLRSAWAACNQFPNTTTCIIQLPVKSVLFMNSTYQSLQLLPTSNIQIQGNGASILQINPFVKPSVKSVGAPFPYTTGKMTNTNSSMQNYKTACTTACYNDILDFSACGYSTSQDSFFRLYDGNNVQVASNDGTCGAASRIVYFPTAPACQSYCLHIGCYQNTACQTVVTASIVHEDYRWVVYAPLVSTIPSPSIPIILIHNLTLDRFGSIYRNGSVISLNGACTITLQDITIRNSIALNGGGIFITNNDQGTITLTNLLIDRAFAAQYGGGYYLRNLRNRRTVVSNLSAVSCVANSTIAGGGGGYYFELLSRVTARQLYAPNCSSLFHGGSYYFSNITNSDISVVTAMNSSAKNFGGGCYFLYLTNSSFSSLQAINTTSATSGGGFYGTKLQNNSFATLQASGCKATDGGGHYWSYIDKSNYTQLVSDNTNAKTT